jgi:hypothetical protein
MSSPAYFLLLEGSSRARLMRSESVYRAALAHQQLLRAVTQPTINQGSLCVALNLGLDHRRWLPPFLPVQRNQDGIFAALVKACCAGTFFGFLPWMILHQSPQPRNFSPDDLVRSVSAIRSDHILLLLIRKFAPRCASTDERNLGVMGEALAELGALPFAEFAAVVRSQVSTYLNGLARQFAGLLERYGRQPTWWAHDVQGLLGGLTSRLGEADCGTPDDLRSAFGPEAALPMFQRLVNRFGQLLQRWPLIVEAASALRARGIRPVDPT